MFLLEILSPESAVFSDSVDEVTLPTEKGDITILTHHVPLFSKLSEGEVRIKKGDKQTLIAIAGGFLEVEKERVSILSDYAVKAENIEVAKAIEAKKRAEELLKNRSENADMLIVEKELQRSILELKIAEKIKRKV